MADGAYIDGVWQAGAGTRLESQDPVTRQPIWTGAAADAEQVAEAVAAARAAVAGWSLRPVSERIAHMERWAGAVRERAETIASIISAEVGKPLWEARTEAAAMAGKVALSVAAQSERAGTRESEGRRLTHHAHGVMAVFGPFNFPGHLPNGHIVPALLAGNTVVLKPSEEAPATGAIFAELTEAAGLPPGVLNIVQGARDTGAALLDAGIDGLLFTGSSATGTHFHRHFGGRPEVILALEMGGNNPLIALDGDADAAADIAFVSAYISAGQRCSCARRLILPTGSWGDAVLERIAARIATVSVGDLSGNAFMGPVINARQAQAALAFEAELVGRGARSRVAFERPEPDGAFLRPALVDVTGVEGIADEELFAPLLQVYRVDGLNAQIARANATRYGLAAGVVTEDDAAWEHARARLRAGVVNRNLPTTGASGAMPFGGPGLSGNSRPGAFYASDYSAWPKASRIADTVASPVLPNLERF